MYIWYYIYRKIRVLQHPPDQNPRITFGLAIFVSKALPDFNRKAKMILKSTSDYCSSLNPDGSVTISVLVNDRVHSARSEVEASGTVSGDFESKFQIASHANPLPRPTDLVDFIDFLTTLDAHLVSLAEVDFEVYVDDFWMEAGE